MRSVTIIKHIFKPSKLKIILLIVILLIAGAGYWYVSTTRSQNDSVKTANVSKGEISEKVTASGVLTGKENATLRFLSGGKVAYVKFQEGDRIEKGDAIAGLDTQSLNIALQQAQNNLRNYQTQSEKTVDDIHLFQYGNGGFGNVGSPNETQSQRATRTAAEVARDNAVDTVRSAERAFQDAVLRSPIEGLVITSGVVAGQNVTGADTVAQIVDDSEIFLDAEVDESDIGKIRLDQRAEVTLNSYPDRVFKGVVSQILPNTRTTTSGATVVVTRIKLDPDQLQFIANINGQADIVVNEATQVLMVPIDAIFEDKYVIVKEGDKFRKAEVRTGLESDTDIEIKSGLEENWEIVTNPGSVKL